MSADREREAAIALQNLRAHAARLIALLDHHDVGLDSSQVAALGWLTEALQQESMEHGWRLDPRRDMFSLRKYDRDSTGRAVVHGFPAADAARLYRDLVVSGLKTETAALASGIGRGSGCHIVSSARGDAMAALLVELADRLLPGVVMAPMIDDSLSSLARELSDHLARSPIR